VVTVDVRANAPTVPLGTPGVPRFAALDAFRAVGALMVVATHVAFVTGRTQGGPFSGLLGRLDVGVAVFFVLSGFLLFRPYVAARASSGPAVSTPRYLIRRATRILPAYWLLVVASLVGLQSNRDATALDWARHLTLTQIYHSADLRDGLSQTWSLCTEVAFYVALPLLALLTLAGRKGSPWRPGRVLALLTLSIPISIAWIVLGKNGDYLNPFTSGLWFPAYTMWFAAGMALAVTHVAVSEGRLGHWRTVADIASAPLACWSVALALLAVATTPLAGPRPLAAAPTSGEDIVKMVLYAAFATFLLMPAVFPPKDGRVSVLLLGTRPIGYLGKISYGIFLWHVLVLDVIREIRDIPIFTGNWLELFALTTVVTILVAAASFHLVEEPIQRLSTRATRRRRTPATATPAPPAPGPA
jgi:peptidoglycan/LPS O-acetylase OafA/YrhL